MQAPAPTDMPCSEQHDCCFRNVPLAPPSLPVTPPNSGSKGLAAVVHFALPLSPARQTLLVSLSEAKIHAGPRAPLSLRI